MRDFPALIWESSRRRQSEMNEGCMRDALLTWESSPPAAIVLAGRTPPPPPPPPPSPGLLSTEGSRPAARTLLITACLRLITERARQSTRDSSQRMANKELSITSIFRVCVYAAHIRVHRYYLLFRTHTCLGTRILSILKKGSYAGSVLAPPPPPPPPPLPPPRPPSTLSPPPPGLSSTEGSRPAARTLLITACLRLITERARQS